jgi:hypothetical protein
MSILFAITCLLAIIGVIGTALFIRHALRYHRALGNKPQIIYLYNRLEIFKKSHTGVCARVFIYTDPKTGAMFLEE